MLAKIGTALMLGQAIHTHIRHGPLATSAPVSNAEAYYTALRLWPSLAMFLLNSHLSKQVFCILIPHEECSMHSTKYSVIPGNSCKDTLSKEMIQTSKFQTWDLSHLLSWRWSLFLYQWQVLQRKHNTCSQGAAHRSTAKFFRMLLDNGGDSV